jgi:hypothetical protein
MKANENSLSRMQLSGLLVSQIGYDTGGPARVLWRSTSSSAPPELRVDGCATGWEPLGECWGSWWWSAGLGEGVREVVAGDCCEQVEFGKDLLWEKTWRAVSYESLMRRAQIAKNRRGWLDCGSHWQEANSHACCLLGLLDLVEFASGRMTPDENASLAAQIRVGIDLLAWYQDLAAELPGGEGGLIHEMPEHRKWLVPADVSKAAAVFARAARLFGTAEEQNNWRGRAEAACAWLARCEPSGPLGFCHEAHGVPKETEIPKDFMTRDLLMEMWAVIELAHGQPEPPDRARHLAQRVLARQFKTPSPGTEYPGQFATFDDWPRPEPAWTHYLGKDAIGNDVGATMSHWLVPLIRLAQWWPHDSLAGPIRDAIERFAHGYFLPACRANPFGILPVGEFPGQGLIWFAGLWHGMNSTYGLAAALALEFERFLGDPAFRPIATANLQWIAGLNSGIHPGVELGCEMSTPHTIPGRCLPVSMIYGIGHRYFGSWKTIQGSISSGFFTGKSFYFDVAPEKASDTPSSFADEDWITFNGGWLSAIARLVSP